MFRALVDRESCRATKTKQSMTANINQKQYTATWAILDAVPPDVSAAMSCTRLRALEQAFSTTSLFSVLLSFLICGCYLLEGFGALGLRHHSKA